MALRTQLIFWSTILALLLVFVFIFKSILLPFVLGFAIAYLLNPAVDGFQKIKIPRRFAALIMVLVFFTSLAVVLTLVTPLLYKQSVDFIAELPNYADGLWEYAQPHIQMLSTKLGIEQQADLKAFLQDNAKTTSQIATKITTQIADSLANGGKALLNILSLIVITPVVAYFVMREWLNITNFVEDLLPRKHKNTILDLLAQINTKIAGFVRGQITLAIILGVSYAIALSIAGLKYGALIGLLAGLFSIIPMVGSILGLVVSIMVAWFQSGDMSFVAIIAAIFLIGQIIEGNILSPKIMGDSVGLHPLWIFFSLLAGGAILGILGMLIAVPAAAIIGVLAAFAITQYKASALYKAKAKSAKKPKATAKKK